MVDSGDEMMAASTMVPVPTFMPLSCSTCPTLAKNAVPCLCFFSVRRNFSSVVPSDARSRPRSIPTNRRGATLSSSASSRASSAKLNQCCTKYTYSLKRLRAFDLIQRSPESRCFVPFGRASSARRRLDGQTVKLSTGQLRLRYHAGFDQERLLTPGQPVHVTLALAYVGHRLPSGSRLRLLISGSNFPWADPNPHTGEPIATAMAMRSALQTVFHDNDRPSTLTLPILP